MATFALPSPRHGAVGLPQYRQSLGISIVRGAAVSASEMASVNDLVAEHIMLPSIATVLSVYWCQITST